MYQCASTLFCLAQVCISSVSRTFHSSSFTGIFPLPLGAWDGIRYFIVALPEPSIYLYYDVVETWVVRLLDRFKFI